MKPLLALLALATARAFATIASRAPTRRIAVSAGFRQEWRNGVSSRADALAALDEACLGVGDVLDCAGGEHVLAFCFLSRAHQDALPRVAAALEAKFGAAPHTSVAVVGGGVIGGVGDEREDGVTSEERMAVALADAAAPALSVLVGALPRGSAVAARWLGPMRGGPAKADGDAWRDLFDARGDEPRGFFLFADPLSRFLRKTQRALDDHFPAVLKVGGLSAPLGDASALALNGELLPFGSCATLALKGPLLRLDCVTSQGCAPVGETYTVTTVEQGQVLVELDDAPAFAAMELTGEGATPREKKLMESQLLVGLRPAAAIREEAEKLPRRQTAGAARLRPADADCLPAEDWLVRQVIGLVPTVKRRTSWNYRLSGIDFNTGKDTPGLAIGAEVRPGDQLRFFVRDAEAADADLALQFRRYGAERMFGGGAAVLGRPVAAVMFQCMGRGAALFGDGAHDSTAFGAEFGDFVTLGGYFANGEVGPLGAITGGASRVDKRRRETHQHEYTTVVAMIASLDDTDDTGD